MSAGDGPSDIRASGRVNKLLGAALLGMAVIPGLPVATGLYLDGWASALRWPDLFYWLAGITLALVCLGVVLLLVPQRSGINVRFRAGGFDLSVRMPLRRERHESVAWEDVARLAVTKASRSSDALWIYRQSGARIDLALSYVRPGTDEVFARFRRSAEAAGFVLERERRLYLLILSRETWLVVPAGRRGQD